MSEYGSIEKLRREHLLDDFDCGKDDLNRFLKRQAWTSQQSHSAQTYVLAKDLRVLGYYSLAAGSVTPDDATERISKGQARHPIPVVLPARPVYPDEVLPSAIESSECIGARDAVATLAHASGNATEPELRRLEPVELSRKQGALPHRSPTLPPPYIFVAADGGAVPSALRSVRRFRHR